MLHYQIPYYYLGHFSKWIPPGSVRLGTQTTNMLEATSWLTPQGNITTVRPGTARPFVVLAQVLALLRASSRQCCERAHSLAPLFMFARMVCCVYQVVMNRAPYDLQFRLKDRGNAITALLEKHSIMTFMWSA